jgi:hypothetical protein
MAIVVVGHWRAWLLWCPRGLRPGEGVPIRDDTAPLDGSFEPQGRDSYFALVHELGHT